MSDKLIVALGSLTDCEALINNFSQSTTHLASFSDFAKVWKSTNFDLILCGRNPEELNQLTSELFGIAKGFILNSTYSCTMRVGALYLLYGLYFKLKNRSSFNKVRITLNELKLLFDFLEILKQNSIKEAIFVFYKLLAANAFLFCVTPTQYIQVNLRCQSEDDIEMGEFSYDNECRLIECDGLSSNSIEDLELLHSKYEEIKSQLPEFKAQNSSLAASNRNFVNEMCTLLDELKTDISDSKGNRNKMKNMNCQTLEENQGALRRRIINESFQAQKDPYRLYNHVKNYIATNREK